MLDGEDAVDGGVRRATGDHGADKRTQAPPAITTSITGAIGNGGTTGADTDSGAVSPFTDDGSVITVTGMKPVSRMAKPSAESSWRQR